MKQRCCPAITKLDPKEPDFDFGLAGEIKEVFVLANNDPLLSLGIAANLNVQGLGQADIKNMLAIKTSLSQILGQGRWQLVINQEFHEVRSTT